MNSSSKFSYMQVAQVKEANAFFQNRLGVNAEATFLSEKGKCMLLKPDDTTKIFLSENTNENQTKIVTLDTADLLEDYCRLKSNGVAFPQMPVNLSKGLSVIFSDPSGNEYIILEKRYYA